MKKLLFFLGSLIACHNLADGHAKESLNAMTTYNIERQNCAASTEDTWNNLNEGIIIQGGNFQAGGSENNAKYQFYVINQTGQTFHINYTSAFNLTTNEYIWSDNTQFDLANNSNVLYTIVANDANYFFENSFIVHLNYTNPNDGKTYDKYAYNNHVIGGVIFTDVTSNYDGISDVAVDKPVTSYKMYNLQGQQQNAVPHHGMYIYRGKKYIAR